MCAATDNCMTCTSTNQCAECDLGYKLNTISSPHKCVFVCPTGSRELGS